MQLTDSAPSNSLDECIPDEVARIDEKARAERLQDHFAGVNARLTRQAMTTPASRLLCDEERY